jgi:hypothetical protein
MNQALASVLAAAGFAVAFTPGPDPDGMPKVTVTTAPEIQAWASG